MTATQEFVVPKSMPMTLPISSLSLPVSDVRVRRSSPDPAFPFFPP
jgi:hypothetical protein